MSTRDDRLQTVLDLARSNPGLAMDARSVGKLFSYVYGDLYSPEEASQTLASFSINNEHPNSDVLEIYAVITAGAFGTKDLENARRFSQYARGRAL